MVLSVRVEPALGEISEPPPELARLSAAVGRAVPI